MRKLADKVERVNVKVPAPIAGWLKIKAKNHGLTLSEQVRHVLIEVKSAEELLHDMKVTKGAQR